jgi:hypothetical protein
MDLLLEPNSAFAAWIDRKAVERVLREHQAGHHRDRQLFLLLSLYYWLADRQRAPLKSSVARPV